MLEVMNSCNNWHTKDVLSDNNNMDATMQKYIYHHGNEVNRYHHNY